MRTIKTLAGTPIELDGDALAVIETISRDLTRRHELAYGFEDVDREIQRVVEQMVEDELRVYLKENLFMNFNRYENDRMLTIVRRASRATANEPKSRAQKTGGKPQSRATSAKAKGQNSRKYAPSSRLPGTQRSTRKSRKPSVLRTSKARRRR